MSPASTWSTRCRSPASARRSATSARAGSRRGSARGSSSTPGSSCAAASRPGGRAPSRSATRSPTTPTDSRRSMTWRERSSATESDAEQLAGLVDDRERFARVAGELRARLGDDFARWAALGIELARATRPGRTAVRAYCALPPARVARLGFLALGRWVGAAVEVACASRQLAEVFVDTTASLLETVETDALVSWAAAGLTLHRDPDLRRSVLAHAFFAAGPRALRLLAPA